MKDALIFDLGMHLGEDTDYYLKKGFDVVAVEANPKNVECCTARFNSEIAAQRLHIISGAIVSNRSSGFITFYQNVKSNWGTVEKDWANRNLGFGKPSVEIRVPIVDLQNMFSKHGIPHYIKIDLQGQELTALSILKSLQRVPLYASVNLGAWDTQTIQLVSSLSKSSSISESGGLDKLIQVLNAFTALGYRKFKVVQQATIPGSTIEAQDLGGVKFRYTFQRHSSGPFGNDLAGDWVSVQSAIELYVEYAKYRGWFDIHAAL